MSGFADNLGSADPTFIIEYYRALKGYTKTLTAASQSLVGMGVDAFDDFSRAVLIDNVSAATVFVQFDGTDATTSGFGLAAGKSLFVEGTGRDLENIRIIDANLGDISIITYKKV